VSSAYRKVRCVECLKFGRVPVKMRKAVRAPREKCLALESTGTNAVALKGVRVVDSDDKRGPLGANRWYGREPRTVLRNGLWRDAERPTAEWRGDDVGKPDPRSARVG